MRPYFVPGKEYWWFSSLVYITEEEHRYSIREERWQERDAWLLDQRGPKNPRFVLSTVATSTDLSRYLFPRSQDVYGKNRLAWQEASYNVRSCKTVCSA